MRVQDISNFKLSVNNGEAIDLPSTGIDVSISDSIYRVSPEMVVTVPDPSGILIGIRAGGYGIHYDFSFESYGKSFSYPMRVDHSEISSLEGGSSAMSGTVKLSLLHSFAFQPSSVRVFKNLAPGKILQNLITEFGQNKFSDVSGFDSSSVLDMEAIYCPSLTPIDFIDKILLPLSSSTSDEINNPFYAFIDARNRFRYVTLKSMLQGKPSKTLMISNQMSLEGKEDFDSGDYFRAIVALPFTQEYSHIYNMIDTETVRLENGEYTSIDSSFKNISSNYVYGFYDREKSMTPYMSEDYFQTSDEMLRLQAGINLKNRKGYLIDKLVVTTLLDLDLTAGTQVKLQSYYGNSNDSMTSYTGEYIIEASEHSWSSKINSGVTKIVLGTPDPFISNTLIAAKAYQG